jgi:hypothetical protein
MEMVGWGIARLGVKMGVTHLTGVARSRILLRETW